ncbi:MCP four helix bundle domain-containing protein [Acidovorax sp. SUPP950]|uniref:methyl-accepting chemotaxis protein n=1 Tax=Acidovorax sp. SUPP950 TaxID=511901 RepID=UPI0023D57B6E|nr:methyl-accepting chemotaxis protein [Acidovorax sp. SUPP950]GKS73399.1 MCP four helix bundle domain-containing protein [Acidovorax sp. SUPP950]
MTPTRFTIGRRLALVLGTILVLFLVSCLYGIVQLRAVTQEMNTMLNTSLAKERAASDWYRNITNGAQRVAAIAKSSDPSLADFFAATAAESSKQSSALQQQIEKMLDSDAERALFAQIGENRKAYLSTRDEVSRLKKEGNAEATARAFTERYEPASANLQKTMARMADLQRSELDAAGERIRAASQAATGLLTALCVGSLLLAALLAWRLTVSITRPLAEARQVAEQIAAMDLTGQDHGRHATDETGLLLRALASMRGALEGSLMEVRNVADSIATATREIATGNADLSQRTEQTASNLQETASSMEELTATVRQSADSAATANKLATSAAEVAARGGQVVTQVVSTMDEINQSSRQISDIIGVIDGIAFQTNILALNAAVEAARAGEQGRGFAVVASEVRSLAGRSADAAKEIKALIGNSVEKVAAGSRLVQDAGTTMEEIVSSVQRVSDIIGEITAATSEQSDGIRQVNTAVNQLDQMTQQNAALVEESAAAAESLNDQASRLAATVARFRLNAMGSAGLARGALAAAPGSGAPRLQ